MTEKGMEINWNDTCPKCKTVQKDKDNVLFVRKYNICRQCLLIKEKHERK